MYNQTNTARGAQGCGQAFEKFSQHGFGRHSRGPWGQVARRPKYNVPINIVDNETSFEVHIYAVGFAKENIKISINHDVLYVTGSREVDEASLPNFSSQEYPIKNFERMIGLNETVYKKGITARQQDGVLVITLPKTAEAKAPTQEIKVD